MRKDYGFFPTAASDFSSENDLICGALGRAFHAISNSQTRWLRPYALPVCSASGVWPGSGCPGVGSGTPHVSCRPWVSCSGDALPSLCGRWASAKSAARGSRQDRAGDRQCWGGESTPSMRREEKASMYSPASLISSTCVA